MHRRSLPIANPCSQPFASMRGGESRRFCDSCRKDVHDLSAMTRVDAERFLAEHAGQRVCVRYRASHTGELRFRPAAAVRPVLATTALSLLAACASYGEEAEVRSPDDIAWQDAAGYAIPFADRPVDAIEPLAPEGKPALPDEPTAPPPPTVGDDGPPPGQEFTIDDIEGPTMGTVAVPEYTQLQGAVHVSRSEIRKAKRERRRNKGS
jgi:hypothetical protein